jgi:hypothetical protein
MPYDPTVSLELLVVTSVANSLKNLNPEQSLRRPTSNAYIDYLILHAPLQRRERAWKYGNVDARHLEIDTLDQAAQVQCPHLCLNACDDLEDQTLVFQC